MRRFGLFCRLFMPILENYIVMVYGRRERIPFYRWDSTPFEYLSHLLKSHLNILMIYF
jgi:hypothetical protein